MFIFSNFLKPSVLGVGKISSSSSLSSSSIISKYIFLSCQFFSPFFLALFSPQLKKKDDLDVEECVRNYYIFSFMFEYDFWCWQYFCLIEAVFVVVVVVAVILCKYSIKLEKDEKERKEEKRPNI